MRKEFIFGLLFFSMLFLGCHIYVRAKDGFAIKKILIDLPKNGQWNSKEAFLQSFDTKIFDQPFRYLGRGGQVFAFESEDKEYVIKLIRYDLLTPTLLMKVRHYFFPDKEKFTRKYNRFVMANNSYFLAYTDLSDLTNVIYSHLEKTDLFQNKLNLIDKLGRSYTIDLDQTGFVLQRKVRLLGDVLVDLKAKKEDAKIKEILTKYLHVLKDRADKGVWIKDHNQFLRNYGVYQDNVYEIDVGSYRVKNEKDLSFFQKNNLDHLKRLHLWIEKELPEHLGYFDNEIDKIIKETQ